MEGGMMSLEFVRYTNSAEFLRHTESFLLEQVTDYRSWGVPWPTDHDLTAKPVDWQPWGQTLLDT